MKLNENFNQQEFIEWISGFLPDFSKDIRKVDVSKSFQGIKSIQTIGESSLGVRVYIIETEQDPSRRKIGLATESFTLLRDYGTPNAIIVYYSENSSLWRLSLLTSTLTWDEGKIKKKLSNPKRQSYVLGSKAKVKTPHQYLINKGSVTDFADLKSRFSLEVVNKEFYKEISSAFIHLVGGQIANGKSKKTVEAQLKLPFVKDHSQTSQEFAVRLIGRIIFCWFLREKRSASGHSLMPRELLSFEASSTIEDYYHKILEPIFFEVLNKPIKTRKDAFINDLFSAIPYLNGGLFSPHEDDFFSYNEDKQSVNHNMVVIPNSWLKSLFETLETYNFTIDENTSFDEELSIDPEMLGRIFENLLAEINPETGESARKSTGSYYTPRLIVDYMVDETLNLFIKEKTNISDEKLRSLISYDLEDDNNNPLNDDEKDKIAQALGSVKILDPACGSGAFPIGALQKIVFILQQIDPQGHLWFKRQIEKTPSMMLRRVIEREFKEKNFDYIRKLGIIQDNIFGVDIQPIATEISRLRCFLTLVVDERIDDTLENRGIEPLPNLDFKFVTANTLVSLPKLNSQQPELFDDHSKIEKLKDLIEQYFTARDEERKDVMITFSELQSEMINELIDKHSFTGVAKAELTRKLTDWKPFKHKTTDWFDPEWMFGIKNGFDVVIANPPYIDSEGMVKNKLESLREYIVNNYHYTRGNWDIYIAFFEKGFDCLNQDGILTYISPDKWISKPFGNELRKQKIDTMFSLLNAGRKIFESAKVDSIVSIFYKSKSLDKLKVCKISDDQITLTRYFPKVKLKPPYALDSTFSKHLELLDKIEKSGETKSLNCENACATSDAYKLSPLIHEFQNGDGKYLKIINTGTIGKWLSKWGQKDMTYLGKKYHMPVVDVDEFVEAFPNSYSSKSVKPKLIIKGLNLLDVCIDLEGKIIPGKSTLMVSGFDNNTLKYLMAFLNSPIAFFYLKEKYPASSYNQGTTFTKDMLNSLPLPQISDANKSKIIDLVNEILEGKDEIRISEIKRDIDYLIYSAYGLSQDEIDQIQAQI